MPLIQQVYYLKLDEKSTGGRAWGRKGDCAALVVQGDAGAQIEVRLNEAAHHDFSQQCRTLTPGKRS